MAYVTIFLILQLLAFVPLDVVQNQFGEHSFARFIVERTPFLTTNSQKEISGYAKNEKNHFSSNVIFYGYIFYSPFFAYLS
ncbi:hypothetical protein EfmAA96_22260 [Enterococcus faecium]|nr:hypothetical protein EfmAA96_22260 [Enterococcus faecium]